MCNVTSNLPDICNRMDSFKQQRTKKGHPDYNQIWLWLRGYHDLILGEACSPCSYCLSQHPEESLSEIGSAVTVHYSCPSAPSFLPQWRVLIFVEIQWKSNYKQAECHFTRTRFSVTLRISIFTFFSVK